MQLMPCTMHDTNPQPPCCPQAPSMLLCPLLSSPPGLALQAAEGRTFGAYDYAKDTSASAYDSALQSAYEQWQACDLGRGRKGWGGGGGGRG